MHDQFDVTLEDGDLLGEVELTTTLMIAASETEDHLSQEEIDRLLGVSPRRMAGMLATLGVIAILSLYCIWAGL